MAECLMTNCRRQAPADAAMCNLHRDVKAVAWDEIAKKNDEINRLKAINADLLEALEGLVAAASDGAFEGQWLEGALTKARTALAKATTP